MIRKIFLIVCFCIALIQTTIVFAELSPVADDDVVVVAITANSIFSSQDKGQTWKERVITEFPEFSRDKIQLSALSCTGKGKKALCVATGTIGEPAYFGIPFLVVSQNGGETWEVKRVSNISSPVRLNNVSCSNSVCVAVGGSPETSGIAVTSTDNGDHWENKINFQMSVWAGFSHVSCMNSGACVAVAANDNRIPFAVYSVDHGNTWSINKAFSPDWQSGNAARIHDMTCVDDTHHPLCVAVGIRKKNEQIRAMILMSTDWGKSWEKKLLPLKLKPYNPIAKAVSCVKDVVTHRSRCFIAGYANAGDETYASTTIDDGDSWQDYSSSMSQMYPRTLHCTGSGIVSTCVVGGNGYAVSRNGGASWAVKYSTVYGGVVFWSSSCTGSGASDSVCLLGGSLGNVAISSDGGKNWKHSKLADKSFVSVAATGGRT